MSPSIIATRAPDWLSAIARLTERVVLPTPPFPAPTAITFLTPGTGCLLKSDEGTARTFAVMSISTCDTPGILPTAARACSRMVSRAADPWMACSMVNTTRPPSMRRFLTNFAATRSRFTEGSLTPRNASRITASETGTFEPFQKLKATAGVLNALRGDLSDQRQLVLFPLVGLEHQQQPEDRGSGDDDENHEQRPENRHELQQDIDTDDAGEHQRGLHRVEPDELVLLLDDEEDDPGDEPDQVAERRRQVGVDAGRRFLCMHRCFSPI